VALIAAVASVIDLSRGGERNAQDYTQPPPSKRAADILLAASCGARGGSRFTRSSRWPSAGRRCRPNPRHGGAETTALAAAHEAWDRGDYPAALKAYINIVEGADSAAALEEIALQTGELYRTRELTTDGRLPRFRAGASVAEPRGAGSDKR
jgi:hypothetical protein